MIYDETYAAIREKTEANGKDESISRAEGRGTEKSQRG